MVTSGLDVFKKYLPGGAQFQAHQRGATALVVLCSPEKLLGYGVHHDPRLAQIMAVGHHLCRRLPEQLGLPMVDNGVWAYGVQLAAARTNSILRAVQLWAMNYVRDHRPQMNLQNMSEVLPLKTLREWLPDAKQAWGWSVPISFFEAEAGILHLQFAILAVENEQGGSELACGVSRDYESPWTSALAELWWQRQRLHKKPSGDLIMRLMANPGGSPWPGLRIKAIQGFDLAQTPGDLPGHLWCACAEGGGSEAQPTFN